MKNEIINKIIDILNEEIEEKNEEFENRYRKMDGLQEFLKLNEGGKKFRGTLLLLCYLLVESQKEEKCLDNISNNGLKEMLKKQMPLAIGIEFCQSAMLIQDDVIDGSSMRRNRKAVHVSLRENKSSAFIGQEKEADEAAILVGSIAFCYAYELIRSACHDIKNRDIMEQFEKMIYKTLGGEMLDVIAPLKCKRKIGERNALNEDKVRAMTEDIAGLKTAEYTFIFPMMAGFMSAAVETQYVLEAGGKLGVVYQLKNDFNGLKETAKNDDIATDIFRFRMTYPNVLLMRNPTIANYILNFDGSQKQKQSILTYFLQNERNIEEEVNRECNKLKGEAFEMLGKIRVLNSKNLTILLEYIEKNL